MHKGVVLLKRPVGVSIEDFRAWFMGQHLEFARARPEIIKYTGSFTVAAGPHSPYENGEPAYDMIAEIWCEDRETVESAFAKLHAAGGIKDVMKHVGYRLSFICEENVIFDRGNPDSAPA